MADAVVTITTSGHVVAHYDFLGVESTDTTTGTGITAPHPVRGFANAGQPVVSVTLVSGATYNVEVRFRNAPSIIFPGFVASSGDLFELLAAQGWTQ